MTVVSERSDLELEAMLEGLLAEEGWSALGGICGAVMGALRGPRVLQVMVIRVRGDLR